LLKTVQVPILDKERLHIVLVCILITKNETDCAADALLFSFGLKEGDYCLGDAVLWSDKDKKGISRKEKLYIRQKIVDLIRLFYKRQGFFEAEIPLLVFGTTPDRAVQSFEIAGKAGLYLTTSTEYHIKRMIAGGFDKVFTVTKNFREYEFDKTHNPEFTMLEWARTAASLPAIEDDAANLIVAIHHELHPDSDYLDYQNARISLKTPWKTMTFQEVFYTQYGLEIADEWCIADIISLIQRAKLCPKEIPAEQSGILISALLDNAIKALGFDAPVLIKKWPAAMTTSSDCESLDAKWINRTEIVIAGIEIADGFPFLCDAYMQRALFEQANTYRKNNNIAPVCYDERYLEMLSHGLPAGAGMALGLDRLCMLFTDSTEIKEVLCFSWEEL
jgi:lysyl-tRNA synthetase class 2